MRKLLVKSADCSDKDLLKIAKRAGFVVATGKKHWKIGTVTGVFITVIPRHPRLKRELVKGVVESFNKFGAGVEVR